MAAVAGMLNWRDMEVGAPEIVRLGAARLNAARVAMLGTLRRDRSPRGSPTEPYRVHGRLLVGAMTWFTAQISAVARRRPPEPVIVAGPGLVAIAPELRIVHPVRLAGLPGLPGAGLL